LQVPISQGFSFLCFALGCTELRSRWCQSGVNFRFVFAFDIELIDLLSKVHHMKRSRISR
jgi:hypothetical protein